MKINLDATPLKRKVNSGKEEYNVNPVWATHRMVCKEKSLRSEFETHGRM